MQLRGKRSGAGDSQRGALAGQQDPFEWLEGIVAAAESPAQAAPNGQQAPSLPVHNAG